ncbi:MAG: DUF29 domain-containing protein [Geminicoccaceae bacterium]
MANAREILPDRDLYQRDCYSWALEQAALLRAHRFAELDLENLAEEIDGLTRAEARELRSRYATLLSHLLKREFQPERRSHSWAATIARERDAIPDHLDEDPDLEPRQAERFAKAYRGARADAAAEANLPLTRIPAACPYTLDQSTSEAFWPGPGPDRPLP